jgi:cobalt transporter subunit CbtB
MVNSRSAVSSTEGVKTSARVGIEAIPNAIIAATIAIALGAAIVFVVGFSHSDLLHAAAHDVRHAAGFPCH